jgi:hypothetical protein
MTMAGFSARLDLVHDGRQSAAAQEICRGAGRLLKAHGFACVNEVGLANGRRADIAAISDSGEIWIVEVKSCLEDFRTDGKWPEYREFCDRLFFAVSPAFGRSVLPPDTGHIVADRYGGEIVQAAPEHRLAAARRKAMTLCLARVASARLQSICDPESDLEGLPRR